LLLLLLLLFLGISSNSDFSVCPINLSHRVHFYYDPGFVSTALCFTAVTLMKMTEWWWWYLHRRHQRTGVSAS
jgi:hypothetical protein